MNPDGFDTLGGPYTLRPPKEPGYMCFPMKMENMHDPHAVSAQPDHNPDSSTSLPQPACPQIPFEKTHSYYQSRSENMYSGHQCSPAFSDFSPGSRSDALLNSVVRTRRRKAGISDEERICIVCGEPASGYNFDRLTCESCKAFFRRNALKPKDKIKACNRGGGCIVEGNQRKHCPSCRLEKCFAVGMKRELILPPEKLEQRAKPRRRKLNSPHGDSCSPVAVTPSASIPTGSGFVGMHPSGMASTNPMGAHSHYALSGLSLPPSLSSSVSSVMRQAAVYPVNRPILNPIDSNPSDCRPWLNPFVRSPVGDKSMEPSTVGPPEHGSTRRLVPCRHTGGRTVCRHQRCRRRAARWRATSTDVGTRHHPRRRRRRRHPLNSSATLIGLVDPEPDAQLLGCLRECAQRIREPFTPDEKLDTGIAVTLEQEYNRMDACIRRIIRVVKLLPYFSDTGKQAQLCLLRTNIYGLIVLYSSFFYERDIRKLRYPILQFNGESSFVTISMLDEVLTPNSPATCCSKDDPIEDDSYEDFCTPHSTVRHDQRRHSSELREEFELYKANTLAAFDHLDHLIGPDDILRVTMLAIKLFTDDFIVSQDDLHASVEQARQTYLLFLWSYLRWRSGPDQLRSATELYARLLISFIDLRTLEIRMTDFAKLLSLDGLSPLMREVCSQRPILGGTKS